MGWLLLLLGWWAYFAWIEWRWPVARVRRLELAAEWSEAYLLEAARIIYRLEREADMEVGDELDEGFKDASPEFRAFMEAFERLVDEHVEAVVANEVLDLVRAGLNIGAALVATAAGLAPEIRADLAERSNQSEHGRLIYEATAALLALADASEGEEESDG